MTSNWQFSLSRKGRTIAVRSEKTKKVLHRFAMNSRNKIANRFRSFPKMRSSYLLASVAAFALLHSTANAFQECMATLKDPHGSVIVRRYGKVVAKLKGGEHFLVERMPDGWNVYLKSGCDGFIEKADLQLLPNEPLMKLNYDPQKTDWQKRQSAPDSELSEAASSGKEHGFDYHEILTAASTGDLKAIARFFSLARFMDGGAADEYYAEQWELVHVVGDDRFAGFLSTQPAKVRENIGVTLSSPGNTDPISKPKPYIRRYFPKTYKLLFATKGSLHT
jgi:hypothetical protein